MISLYEKYSLGFSSLPTIPKNFTSGDVKKHNQRKLAKIKEKPKELRKTFNSNLRRNNRNINKEKIDSEDKEIKIEEALKNYELFYEVSQKAPKELQELSAKFKQLKDYLKNDIYNETKKIEVEITDILRRFTGIKNLEFQVYFRFSNTIVLINYKNLVKFYSKNKNETPTRVIKENPEHIEKCRILMGDEDIKKFTPDECVAILLHEFGHIYAHKSKFPFIFKTYAQILLGTSGVGITFSYILNLITNAYSPAAYLPYIGIIVALTRSLSFYDHMGEYNADKFAVKYGYGDEIFSVIRQSQLKTTKPKERKKTLSYAIKKLLNFQTHPYDTDRLCKIAKDMQKEYTEMYPKLSQHIKNVVGKLNC
ncbi:MAG: M48 family metalloprotease [bacterium]